jgi:hypothetical protein
MGPDEHTRSRLIIACYRTTICHENKERIKNNYVSVSNNKRINEVNTENKKEYLFVCSLLKDYQEPYIV